MAIDTRDWYRNRFNKKTGYSESAAFRVSHRDLLVSRRRREWRNFWIGVAVFAFLFFVLVREVRSLIF